MPKHTSSSPATLPFNPDTYFLGGLCKRGHEFGGTGKSLCRHSDGSCKECHTLARRARLGESERLPALGNRNAFSQMRANNRRRGFEQDKYTNRELLALVEAFGWRCGYCGADVSPCPCCSQSRLNWDHFNPKGRDALSNLVPACPSCNMRKSGNDPLLWFRSQPFYSEDREGFILDHIDRHQQP